MRRSGPSTWPPARALRRFLARHPALYLPMRRKLKPQTVVRPDTELTIEGFPRCGNTWTEAVIRHCGRDDIRLAHHSHAVANVRQAVTLGVPVMVLYRHPDPAVQSYLTLYGNRLDPREGYRDYLEFYRGTLPLRESGAVFYSFEDTTERTGDMVADLNARFGLELDAGAVGTEEQREAVFRRMDEKAARLRRAQMSQARPGDSSAEKAASKAAAREAIERPEVKELRAEALALYETIQSSLGAVGT